MKIKNKCLGSIFFAIGGFICFDNVSACNIANDDTNNSAKSGQIDQLDNYLDTYPENKTPETSTIDSSIEDKDYNCIFDALQIALQNTPQNTPKASIKKSSVFIENQIDDIMDLTKDCDSDTLFVFDCDDVLQKYMDLSVSGKLFNELKSNFSENQEYGKIISEIFLNAEIETVDKKMVKFNEFIQYTLKSKKLVLTQCGTGQLGNITSMVDWRIKALNNLGYDFASSWEGIPEKEFPELNTNSPRLIPTGTIPVFKNGIACACDVDKGEFLIKVLDYIKSQDSTYFPKKIFYIDDNIKQVESVSLAAKKLNMDFTGVHYVAAKNIILKNTNSIDQNQVTEIQINYLKKSGLWINYELAWAYYRINLICNSLFM